MAKEEVVQPTVPSGPQVRITKVPDKMRHAFSGRADETVKGGMIVARINGGQHFQVQNAEGEPIPGKVFDPETMQVVEG